VPRIHFRALSTELVAAHRPDDPEIRRRASRMAAFSLAMLVWVPVFAIIYLFLSAPLCANIILSGGTLLLGILLLLRRGVAPEICGNLLTLAAWYVYTALALLTGGLTAPVMVWYATLPILSVLLCGTRSGMFWTATCALTVGAFALVDAAGLRLPIEVTPGGLKFLQLTGLAGLFLCVYLLVSVLKKMEFGARQALHDANFRLAQQASTDGLTGIPNRHRFDAVLEQEWLCHDRADSPLSLALIDADFFKAFNDEYGHLAGDECLRTVARAIQASLRRPRDFCARFGGEEFVIVLPNTDERGALHIAHRIQEQVGLLQIGHATSPISACVTVSIGVCTTVPSRDRSHLDFLYDVDMALYRAKEQGRDRIVQVVTAPVAV
jgi:diguanylate cyclase (GGDEF)-like protein